VVVSLDLWGPFSTVSNPVGPHGTTVSVKPLRSQGQKDKFRLKVHYYVAGAVFFTICGGVCTGFASYLDKQASDRQAAQAEAQQKSEIDGLDTKLTRIATVVGQLPNGQDRDRLIGIISNLSGSWIALRQLNETQFLGQDEYHLEESFGLFSLQALNIRIVADTIRHHMNPQSYTPDFGTHPRDGESLFINLRFVGAGHLGRVGGVFVYSDPGTADVPALCLPAQYSAALNQLHGLENSSVLPSKVRAAVQGLDDAVTSDVSSFQAVLNEATKRIPDYFLEYDDINSPYCHLRDKTYFDRRVLLEPKVDAIRKAVRDALDVG
jgi:hypothetical protein